jgi:hypothetical protein
MARTASVTHFVAVSDLSNPLTSQEGILLEVAGKGGDTPKNRARALEIAHQMWERGEIAADKFPDGLTQDNIFYIPSDSPHLQFPHPAKDSQKLPPIIQGAQEIVELTKLQLEVQQIAQEAQPYLPIIQAVLERTRPLTAEERELVQDKRFAKTLERLAATIAEQEHYRENCAKYGKLILNAITWQLNKGVKEPTQTQKKSSPKRGIRSVGSVGSVGRQEEQRSRGAGEQGKQRKN